MFAACPIQSKTYLQFRRVKKRPLNMPNKTRNGEVNEKKEEKNKAN